MAVERLYGWRALRCATCAPSLDGPGTSRPASALAYHGRVAPNGPRPLLQFSAGGLVIDESGNILLIRARDLRNRPVWTLPKGALAPGESSEAAALREVREETGYRCEVVRELPPVTYWFQRDGQRIRKSVRWYLMRPLEKVGEHDHEVDEVAWAAPDEADARLRYASDRQLLSLVRAG
jgi:8-oxo-dGTP pyrophosphatase MutT (NUDIX family)